MTERTSSALKILPKIGAPGFRTISRPQYTTAQNVKVLIDGNPNAVVAEIGVGIGATSKLLCETMQNRGSLHLYDFEDRVQDLKADLNALGFTNIVAFGNTTRYWDSYHWSLIKQIQQHESAIYDYIYLDGAHTALHDTAAFFMCDRLLKIGGTIDIDDYGWSFSKSNSMKSVRHRYMTEEQEQAKQVGMVVDIFINGNPKYEPIVPNRIYKKVS